MSLPDVILLSLAGALALFILILLVRAACFAPPKRPAATAEPVEYDATAAAEHLAMMIRCKTIANRDPALMDKAEYDRFTALLPELYPNAFRCVKPDRAGITGLIYRWEGVEHDRPAILMAHYDVVPANAEEWSFEPFSGEVRDGIVYGRGTLDTKSTLCAIFEAVDRLCAEGYVPARDILLCFSGTEEIAGEGAYAIVEKLRGEGICPSITVDEGGAIVTGAFPGVKQPCAVVGIAEKGQMAIRLAVRSAAGHASAPPQNSAFVQLARAIVALEEHQFKPQMTPAARQMFRTLGRYSGFGLRIVFGNLGLFTPLLKRLARSFGSEMNALMRTTYVCTMAKGSDASNVLPAEASVTCDARILSGSSSAEVLEHFQRVIDNDNVVIEPIFTVEPSPCSPTACDQWRQMARAITETWPQAVVSPYLMMARSDSSAYTAICENVYRFAPMELTAQERAMIHGRDEQIPAAKLAKAAEFYHRLIKSL